MDTSAIVVGIMTVELVIPEARSLKEKRMVIQSLRARLKNRSNVAVSEVGHQDVWQRCALAVVTVGGMQGRLERVLDEVREEIEKTAGAMVAGEQREFR